MHRTDRLERAEERLGQNLIPAEERKGTDVDPPSGVTEEMLLRNQPVCWESPTPQPQRRRTNLLKPLAGRILPTILLLIALCLSLTWHIMPSGLLASIAFGLVISFLTITAGSYFWWLFLLIEDKRLEQQEKRQDQRAHEDAREIPKLLEKICEQTEVITFLRRRVGKYRNAYVEADHGEHLAYTKLIQIDKELDAAKVQITELTTEHARLQIKAMKLQYQSGQMAHQFKEMVASSGDYLQALNQSVRELRADHPKPSAREESSLPPRIVDSASVGKVIQAASDMPRRPERADNGNGTGPETPPSPWDVPEYCFDPTKIRQLPREDSPITEVGSEQKMTG